MSGQTRLLWNQVKEESKKNPTSVAGGIRWPSQSSNAVPSQPYVSTALRQHSPVSLRRSGIRIDPDKKANYDLFLTQTQANQEK